MFVCFYNLQITVFCNHFLSQNKSSKNTSEVIIKKVSVRIASFPVNSHFDYIVCVFSLFVLISYSNYFQEFLQIMQ